MRSPFALAALAILALVACNDNDNASEALPFGLASEIVTPADHASDIVFAPDGRIFFTEQFTGDIRVVNADGTHQEQPFAHVDVANWLDLDWGLTGLAMDPGFQNNHYVYAFYTSPANVGLTQPAPTQETTRAPEQTMAPTGAAPTVAPPSVQTAPGGQNEANTPSASATDSSSASNPVGQPILVRFTEREGVGEEITVISDDFPPTLQAKAGYNANGNLHFGPDGMLYVSVGDYDTGPQPTSLDLATPIGKLLRIDPQTGEAPPDNPYMNEPGADPRIFAIGFREPFDFAFHPSSQAIYGTDNTPYSCEELNVIRGGLDYGWPNVGEFPYSQCGIGDQVAPIYYFAREGKQPGDYLSLVEITGLTFTTGARYPTLGDSLIVCEGHRSLIDEESPGVLRRLVLGADGASVSVDDPISRDCKGDAESAPDGTVYYANNTEIRRLLPGATSTASGSVVPSP